MKPAGEPHLAMDLKEVQRAAEERLGRLESTLITGHLLKVAELANCHFLLSLTESSAGAKVQIMWGTHSLLNTGHEAMQLEFNLSGTDVNAKGTCAGPW